MDGQINRDVTEESFATIRAGAGTSASPSGAGLQSYIGAGTTQDLFIALLHSYLLFDTSSLGASAIISSAKITPHFYAKDNGLGSPDIHVASSNPASNTDLVSADFQNVGRTSFGSLTYASVTVAAYNDITLNANGLANISLTGISKFSLQLSWDINNSYTGTWVSSGFSRISAYAADQTGTTQDPKLTVTYTVPITPKQDVIWFE